MVPETKVFQGVECDYSQIRDILLDMMIEKWSSDMYLTVWEPPCMRIDSDVVRLENLDRMDTETIWNIAASFLTSEEEELFFSNRDVDFWRWYKDRRFRLNISKQQRNTMIVIRLLSAKIPTIEEIWLPDFFKDIIKKKGGIILLAGPTWSGKSTTLAALIQEINKTENKHIITIEDPIEYVFKPDKCIVEQKQLWTDVVSFPRALKSCLRQNPDVILFGEMRDSESIKYAITLAETWHLVMSTIHSKSSSQTISKIVDSFPAGQQDQIRLQLSESLIAVVSQRLIRKKNWWWFVVALEIMMNNTAIGNVIRKNEIEQINNVLQTNKKYWMQTLEEHLIDLVLRDEIDLEDALRNANDPNYIVNDLKTRRNFSVE